MTNPVSALQLPLQLAQKSLPQICWLYGNDAFLLQDSEQQIIETLSQKNLSLDQKSWALDQISDDQMMAELCQTDLFSSHRYIRLSFKKLTASYISRLTALFEHLHSHDQITVVLHSEGLTRAQQQAKWLNPFLPDLWLIEHWSLSTAQFEQWFKQRAKRRGLDLSHAQLNAWLAATEGNCSAGAQAIERLILDPECLPDLNDDAQCFSSRDLIEAILSKKTERIIQICQDLKHAKPSQLPLFLWVFSQLIQTLIQLICTPCSEHPLIFRTAGIAFLPLQRQYLAFVKHHTLESLLACQGRLTRLDQQFKGGASPLLWENTLDLALTLAI